MRPDSIRVGGGRNVKRVFRKEYGGPVLSAQIDSAEFRFVRRLVQTAVTFAHRISLTKINLFRTSRRANRKLEIGPGSTRIEGFETLNIIVGQQVDFALNAGRRLPFRNGSFEVIYASHILEHIPWYKLEPVLQEWVRILEPGGRLEIWVPDGLKICKGFVDAETNGSHDFDLDDWWRFNDQKDPCVWANGRVFSYGDGTGRPGDQNWHRALFSERHLFQLLKSVGLLDIRSLDQSEIRAYDHGWINMGVVGTKPPLLA